MEMGESGIGVLRLPASVQFGTGARAAAPRELAAIGRRVVAIVDPFLATTPAFIELIDQVTAGGLEVVVRTDVQPELPVDSLAELAADVHGFSPDVVLGYGGGSALDAAKLVALLLAHGGPLSRYYGENAVPGPVLPIVAIPTTAGTGSEVTPVAVVADSERELKVGISSPFLIPRVAIVDPELSAGAPATVTAYAGIDALVHAIESYASRALPADWSNLLPVFVGRNALTDAISLDAIRHIGSSIERAVAHGDDMDARSGMAIGSLQAGIAFGASGTHLAHALQYPIGAATHTPHGLGTGLMLPYVLELCAQTVPDRVADIGRALGLPETPDLVIATVDRVAEICANIGLPASLAGAGGRTRRAAQDRRAGPRLEAADQRGSTRGRPGAAAARAAGGTRGRSRLTAPASTGLAARPPRRATAPPDRAG